MEEVSDMGKVCFIGGGFFFAEAPDSDCWSASFFARFPPFRDIAENASSSSDDRSSSSGVALLRRIIERGSQSTSTSKLDLLVGIQRIKSY
jgi:hypothetical protein